MVKMHFSFNKIKDKKNWVVKNIKFHFPLFEAHNEITGLY